MKKEIVVLNEEREVTLTAYIQDISISMGDDQRPAILILPGGAYKVCSQREADPVAFAYLNAGYHVFILRYTLKDKGGWPYPIEDYEQAMECIIKNSERWKILEDKIAVVGFSAGGHLAACAATLAKNKPAAAILGYPAILEDPISMCQPGCPYPNEYVTRNTCPCFLVSARDDQTVSVKNSLAMQLALTENHVSFESHIYSYGGHGFSTGHKWANRKELPKRASDWVDDSIEWLSEVLGELTTDGVTEPFLKIAKNADDAPMLSIDCSLNCLLNQKKEVQEVLEPVYCKMEEKAKRFGFTKQNFIRNMGESTLRKIMEIVRMSDLEAAAIDAALHQFENIL